jgi:hypothetical protein
MPDVNDWTDIAEEIRAIMHDEAKLAQRKAEVKHFYEKNAFTSGDYFNGLAEATSVVGSSRLVKQEIISFVTYTGDFGNFLDSGVVGQADRRATIEQLRAVK